MMTSIFGNTDFDFFTELDRAPPDAATAPATPCSVFEKGLSASSLWTSIIRGASVYALDHPGAGPGRVRGLELKEYYVGNGDSRPIERCGVC